MNSSIHSDDNRIKLDGYNLIRSDHPSDSKRGGVCIYYKEHIPLVKRDDICTLDTCLVMEIRSQNEKCCLTCIYRSQARIMKNFKIFEQNLIHFLTTYMMNFQSVQFSQEILMLAVEGGGKMISLTQQV